MHPTHSMCTQHEDIVHLEWMPAQHFPEHRCSNAWLDIDGIDGIYPRMHACVCVYVCMYIIIMSCQHKLANFSV